ncbi:hypothetical protein JXR93_13760 [bacterium]|nr:hypothetical protein [bacterium]
MKNLLLLSFLIISVLFISCGDDEKKSTVTKCTIGGTECSESQLCLFNDKESTYICTESCSETTPCSNGMVCESIENESLTGCFLPAYISGKVFDIQSLENISNARVIASTKTGDFISNLSVTSELGEYIFLTPTKRDHDGKPLKTGQNYYLLNITAQNYINYPSYFRAAIPIYPDDYQLIENSYIYKSTLTEIPLVPLQESEQNGKSISGKLSEKIAGVMIVAQCETSPCPYTYSDLNGEFLIFNVKNGNYKVKAYKKGLSYDSVDIIVNNADVNDVILTKNSNQFGTVSGSVNIVNAPGGSLTSVVLIPKAIFHSTFIKGEIAPGLRAPEPPTEPNITGDYAISGIPEGDYVVLAAFENDGLVRDPDQSIGGTQIVYFSIPQDNSYSISLDNFKVTEALEILSPGANEIEGVIGAPIFSWKDDSSEDEYFLELFNVYGEIVYTKIVPKSGGEDLSLTYDGDPLEVGMFYQWRVTSRKTKDGGINLSTSEDLKGIFYIEASEE